ncbi:SDR family oxidoreductase [Rhizobium sp. CRIBSB]|nr:SDR family oxidoreductase [Rhizobium sp. CRIBSB]
MSETGDATALLGSMFGLAGKVALLTGGSVGMGRAAGLAMAAAGARVILADDAVRVATLSDLPAGVEAVSLDVTDEAAVDALLADIVARHGGLDILVNGAVLNHNRNLLEISGDEWDRVQAVNLKSAFLASRAAIPAMRTRGGGRIINLSTMGSVHPVLNGNAAYSSSRAGLNQLTRNIALDFAADHITANAILPGAIITETVKSGFVPTGPGADLARHLGGFGRPDDVTGLILLLAGPSGRFISGQSIAVDGGFLVS